MNKNKMRDSAGWLILGFFLGAFLLAMVLFSPKSTAAEPDPYTYPAYSECWGKSTLYHVPVFNPGNKAITVRVEWLRNGMSQYETYRVGRRQGVLTGILFRSTATIEEVKVSFKGNMFFYRVSPVTPLAC